jgi:prolyl oligopeptidase family protein
VFGAFTGLEVMNQSPYVEKTIPQIWPDDATHKEEIIRRRSAKYWPDLLSVPLLIMNGGTDQQVDPIQPLQLAEQLQRLGKTYELIIYAQDNHFLVNNRDDRDSTMERSIAQDKVAEMRIFDQSGKIVRLIIRFAGTLSSKCRCPSLRLVWTGHFALLIGRKSQFTPMRCRWASGMSQLPSSV